jgi:hypothetical protein
LPTLRRGAPAQMTPGCVRKIVFSAPFFGDTVSELTAAEPGPAIGSGTSRVKWRQLSTDTRLNM